MDTDTSAYVVKTSDLAQITEILTDNLAVIVPFGIGITAILVGVSFIPRLIKRFTKG